MACENTTPISNMIDVWDATGNYKVAIQMNVTDLSSSNSSKLLDLLVDDTSEFGVDKYGNICQFSLSSGYPTVTEYPNDGTWGIHKDVVNKKRYLTYNNSGTIETLEFGSSSVSVSDEGSLLTTNLAELDFVGDGVVASISGQTVTVTIPLGTGGGGSGMPLEIQDEGIQLHPDVALINFVGDGVVASGVGNAITVTIPNATGISSFTGVITNSTISGDGLATVLGSNFSLDIDNIITTGTDGGLYVPITETGLFLTTINSNLPITGDGTGTIGLLLSTDVGNIMTTGVDGGLFAEASGTSGSTLQVLDEGVLLGNDITGIDFVGSGIKAEITGQDATVTVLSQSELPAFTLFDINVASDPLEVGAVVGGTTTYSWLTTNSNNISGNVVSIDEVTSGVNLITDTPNDGSQSGPVLSGGRVTPGAHVYRISATNILGNTFSKDYDLNFYSRIYYGESSLTGLNEAQVEALRVSFLADDPNGLYQFLGNGYKYIAYPTGMGQRSLFLDIDSDINVAMEDPYVLNMTSAFGINNDYFVHRSTNIFASGINIQIRESGDCSVLACIGSATGVGAALAVKDEGINITDNALSIDFVGTNVAATQIDNNVTVNISGGLGDPISLYDEGSLVTNNLTGIDFVGIGVSTSGDGQFVTVSITGGGGGGGSGNPLVVLDEGIQLHPDVMSIDFTGLGVTATNIGNAITVEIPFDSGVIFTGVSTDNTISGDGSGIPLSVNFSADLGNIISTGTDAAVFVPNNQVQFFDESILLTSNLTGLNFIGAGVLSSGNGQFVTIDIPGGTGTGGGSLLEVQDEGISLSTDVALLDFVGTGVTVNGAGNDMSINIPGFNPLATHNFGVQQYLWTPMASEAVVDITGSSPSQTTTLTNNRTLSFTGTMPSDVDRVYYAEITPSGFSLSLDSGNDPSAFFIQPTHSPFVLAFKVLSDGTPRFAGVI